MIHVYQIGGSLCGRLVGEPASWPWGEWWRHPRDWKRANCSECREKAPAVVARLDEFLKEKLDREIEQERYLERKAREEEYEEERPGPEADNPSLTRGPW